MSDETEFDKTLYRVFHENRTNYENEKDILIQTLTLIVFTHKIDCYAPFLYEFGHKQIDPKLFHPLIVKAALYGHPGAFDMLARMGIYCTTPTHEETYVKELGRVCADDD